MIVKGRGPRTRVSHYCSASTIQRETFYAVPAGALKLRKGGTRWTTIYQHGISPLADNINVWMKV